MKRTATLISCLILGIAACMAQSLSEAFTGSDLLTQLFVNPLGIRDLPASADPRAVEEKMNESGIEYTSKNLGHFGEMFHITPSGMKIGDAPIAGMGISINNDAVMVLYQSEACDNYRQMCEILDKSLRNCAIDVAQSEAGDNPFTVYMITDRYGIAVGSDEAAQTSLAILLDIRNLQGFLGLGSLMPQ